ncbi:MAG: ABC transporter permease [Actinomycetota bacterium]|nr:ABC transporter permease [Actinomycetota bacterium]
MSQVGNDPLVTLEPYDEDQTATATAAAELAVNPELVANSLGEYVRAWFSRVRGGDSGVLPVIIGMLVIAVIFESLNSKFLTAGNLVNLLVQGAVYMLLAMAEVFALLLGEIDLSAGFVGGVGGIIAAELVTHAHGSWPWWAACGSALAVCAAIGAFQGTIITRIGLPSFVVTLAGLLGFQGVMLLILGNGGTLPINDKVINDFANGRLTPTAGWIVMGAVVAAFALMTWQRDSRRRASGLVAPPSSLTALKIGGAVAAGMVVVLISNVNRGAAAPIRGMPWVVLIVLAVVSAWSVLLGRTKFGRYVYAIGGNAEAARRAGINLALIRTLAFTLASFTAGIAGIIYASRLRSVSTNLDGGQLVLYAVAAAVIGGTSLFGGRGKAMHAVLGGIVIAAIDNGMGLQGFSAASKFVVTGIVLLAAVTIDAVARRGRTAGR